MAISSLYGSICINQRGPTSDMLSSFVPTRILNSFMLHGCTTCSRQLGPGELGVRRPLSTNLYRTSSSSWRVHISNRTRYHSYILPHLAKGDGLCAHRRSARPELRIINDSTQYAELFEAKPNPLFRIRCIRRTPSARVVSRTVDENVLGDIFPAVFGRPGELILNGHDFRFVSCSAHGCACPQRVQDAKG